MTVPKLSEDDVRIRLQELPDWRLEAGKLRRDFEFKDFVGAFGYMSSVALVAERKNHHPEWFNVYRNLKVELQTHDAEGGPAVTHKDFELAKEMSQLYSSSR